MHDSNDSISSQHGVREIELTRKFGTSDRKKYSITSTTSHDRLMYESKNLSFTKGFYPTSLALRKESPRKA